VRVSLMAALMGLVEWFLVYVSVQRDEFGAQ